MRLTAAFVITIAVTMPAGAADGPSGSYRLAADLGGDSFTALLTLTPKDGQYLGGLGLDARLKPAIRDVRVNGNRLRFVFALSANEAMTFDGRLPVGRGPIPGTLAVGDTLVLVTLEPSALTTFDRGNLLKEIVTTGQTGPLHYAAAIELLRSASETKAKLDDVKAWADRAVKAAEPHGVRWKIATLLRLGGALAGQPAYAGVTLDLAREAERLLDPTEEVGVQLPVYDLLVRAARHANDPSANSLQAKLQVVEARDYQDYQTALPLRPDPFTGRKAKSDRIVLVELFSGADDPPSVAAALAFDALPRTYKPTDVVRLQYHLHRPDANPLATRASESRWSYYQGRTGGGTPLTIINGRPDPIGGGRMEFASAKLKQYRSMIDPWLDTPAKAGLQLAAKRDGNKLAINARVSGIAKPSDKVRLRLAVAETVVRYGGRNGLRYHHCVVRGFAGSVDGWPLIRAAVDQSVTVDLDALRAGLNAELDEYQKKEGLLLPDRPLALRTLLIVGFVQDDVNREVLQAGQTEVQ
jgi:hypothetical protein